MLVCLQVYTGSWGDLDGTIRCRLGDAGPYELGEEPEPRREAPVFDTPTRGTSVEKFREMVFNHLKVKQGLAVLWVPMRCNICSLLEPVRWN